MAYRRAKRYGRRRAIRRRAMRTRVRRRAPVSEALKRYIRTAVSRPAEKKLKSEHADTVSYNGAATVQGDIIPVLPIVQIGDTSYNREGRSIKANRATLTMVMRWSGDLGAKEAPLFATVWHVRDKLQKSFQYVADNTVGSYPADYFSVLLDTLNNPLAPVGDWNEPGMPLNLRRFVIRRKTFRLTPSSLSYTGGAGTTGAGSGDGEDGAVLMRTIRINAMIPRGGKVLTYRTDGDNYPHNHNEYCFITYMRPTIAAGSTTVSSPQLTVVSTRRLHFTDS